MLLKWVKLLVIFVHFEFQTLRIKPFTISNNSHILRNNAIKSVKHSWNYPVSWLGIESRPSWVDPQTRMSEIVLFKKLYTTYFVRKCNVKVLTHNTCNKMCLLLSYNNLVILRSGPEVVTNSYTIQLSIKRILHINVKMPMSVDIYHWRTGRIQHLHS